jgi:hypothetical protein
MIIWKRITGLMMVGGLMTTGLSAQDRVTTAGMLGGISFATFSGEDIDGAETKAGLALGGYVSFGMSPRFAIETGALYSQRGAKASDQGFTLKLKVDYIEVPLLLSTRFPGQSSITPFFSAGPAVAVKVGCGVSFSGGGASVDGGCEDAEDELDGGLKSVDAGLVGALGIEVRSFRVMARYYLGMTSIVDGQDGTIKNRVFSLLVGYGFRLR